MSLKNKEMLGISWVVVLFLIVQGFYVPPLPYLNFGNRIKTLQSSFAQVPVMCEFHFDCLRMITV